MYLFQHTVFGIHSRFPQLLGVHFTQTFVTLCVDCVFRTAAICIDKFLALCVRPAILFYFTFLAKIEWGSSDVQVAVLDNLRHIAEEERHNQRVDVRTIDIGIGHDDNLVITQFVDIGSFAVIFGSDSHAKSCIDIANFITFQSFVVHCFFYVQNLTAQRKNSLEHTVTSLFGSTTCRITLDKE